jgi:hypothetical protein
MSAVVTTAVAVLSAGTAVASFVAYLYYVRRSDLVAAREEALALAETRRQVIRDLQQRARSAEEKHRRARANAQRRVRELQAELDRTRAQARQDAFQTQHFHAAALSELGEDLLAELRRTPPDVESAIARVQRLLSSENPVRRRSSPLES